MNRDKVSAHLLVDHYGEFQLTGAVRPSLDLQVVPRQGYRRDTYRDSANNLNVPFLAASVSAERLFEVFLDLLEPLGEVVDVILETSHDTPSGKHRDLVREQIDRLVLLSNLYDFEDLLLNDGCTGVAIISNDHPMEVQFDEHKLLVVYARNPEPFERVFREAGVARDDRMKLITEGEHLHNTEERFLDSFDQICFRLGIGEPAYAE